MNTELEQALAYDPIADAERRAGKSWHEDDAFTWVGIGLMQNHAAKKNALLKKNRDTCHDNTLTEQIDVIEDMGFRLLVCEPITGTEDKWRIFWRPGVLLFCDSYRGDKTLNSGKAYFNYCGPREAMHRCSNGLAGEIDGVEVWEGSVDVREGLRHCLDSLSEAGRLLETWINPPSLWLLHYMDAKVEGYDHWAITAERLAMLPEDVRAAISGHNTKS